MSDVVFLAWRYLLHHRAKSVVLVAAVALIVALPVGLRVLIDRTETHLRSRATVTPLIIGAKGSALELTLNSLYFESDPPRSMGYDQVTRIAESTLATPVPLHNRFRARGRPIVGTALEYFELRGLTITEGRSLATLGECVLGANAARDLGLAPGDALVSTPESVFDLAGVYPLKMRIVGILAPSGSPDDLAVFVDVKTAWVIEGLAHGHEDLSRPEAAPGVLSRTEGEIVANASVKQYNEITPENIDSFHFHGDPSVFPVTAVIAVPRDAKSAALLQGRYVSDDEIVQIVRPPQVMDDLLGTILTVERYVRTAIVSTSAATLCLMGLVFVLSLQLRRREMQTMLKIGASSGRIATVVATEVLGVVTAGVILAGLITLAIWYLGDEATRLVVRWS